MRTPIAPFLVALAALASENAFAQTRDDVARAEALFNAGKALTDAGQFTDACGKFAESKRLAPGLGVTLYLADCYEHVGRVASAWTEFRSAEGLARERNDKRADVARARAQALEPKLNRLTIAVAPSIPKSALQVLRDGVLVPEEELGQAVPVDPGDHVVVVSSPGHKMRSFDAHLGAETSTATVRVDSLDEPIAPAPEPTPPAMRSPLSPATSGSPPVTSESTPATSESASTASASVSPPPPIPGDRGASRRWTGLGVAGLGVVGLGVGSAFALLAKSKLDESNAGANPPCDPTDHCTSNGLTIRKDAEGAAAVSTIAFVAGGIAIAAGIGLYVTAPRSSPGTGVVVAPIPLAGGGGAMVQTRF
jgi:hypothetical protein